MANWFVAFAESPGLGARNDRGPFTKVDKSYPTSAIVAFSQLMTRGRAEIKGCENFPNIHFQSLLMWPVHDPILSHRTTVAGKHIVPKSALQSFEQSENMMYLSSRMFSSCMSYPHQEWEKGNWI